MIRDSENQLDDVFPVALKVTEYNGEPLRFLYVTRNWNIK